MSETALILIERSRQTPEAERASGRKYKAKNKDKLRAHAKHRTAVRNGTLKKPDKCSKCGGGGRLEFHHTHGYSDPLKGRFLCRACHAATPEARADMGRSITRMHARKKS